MMWEECPGDQSYARTAKSDQNRDWGVGLQIDCLQCHSIKLLKQRSLSCVSVVAHYLYNLYIFLSFSLYTCIRYKYIFYFNLIIYNRNIFFILIEYIFIYMNIRTYELRKNVQRIVILFF